MQETNIPPELRERFEKMLYQYDIGNMIMVELLFAAYNMDRNEWVSVKDRLPEHGEKVLICFESGNILIGKLQIDSDHKDVSVPFI